MNYQGKPLTELSEEKKVQLIEALAAELRMAGGTEPSDLKIEDVALLLPPKEQKWGKNIAAVLYKGKGKPGGK